MTLSTDPTVGVEKSAAPRNVTSTSAAPTREALLIELANDVIAEFGDTGFGQSVGARLSTKARAALSQPAAPANARAVVSIKPMALSDGRTDYFVSIKVGDRDVTPHVFREEYKAAYHVALYDWLLNGSGEEPDCVAFGPNDWPAKRTSQSGNSRRELIEQEARRRCESADYPLERVAREDRRFRHDDTRPWWQAYFVPKIEGLIASVEQAGFVVLPPLLSPEKSEMTASDARILEAETSNPNTGQMNCDDAGDATSLRGSLVNIQREIGQKVADFAADYAALREAMEHLATHRDAWRRALGLAAAMAAPPGVDHDDASYWARELRAFDQTFAALQLEATAPVGDENVQVLAIDVDSNPTDIRWGGRAYVHCSMLDEKDEEIARWRRAYEEMRDLAGLAISSNHSGQRGRHKSLLTDPRRQKAVGGALTVDNIDAAYAVFRKTLTIMDHPDRNSFAQGYVAGWNAQEASASFATNAALREELLSRLIQDALDVLHHDRTEGSDVDRFEHEQLHKRFSRTLVRDLRGAIQIEAPAVGAPTKPASG
jgi:hypothetical protein